MSNQLETIVNSIRNLYQKQQSATTQNFVEIAHTSRNSLDTFKKNLQHLETIKQAFTLPDHTCALVAISCALTQAPNVPNVEKLLSDIEELIQNSDDKQIAHIPDQFAEVCHYYTNTLVELKKSKRGLVNLKVAISKLQKNKNELTSIHADLILLSLEAKNFTPALELLENDILDINTGLNSFDSKHYLTYFYYSGCVFTALKEFEQALFYFEQAITIPCQVVSQIMIEAYKKFILLSLMTKAKLLQLPKYTSRYVINQIKPQCSIYHDIASAFISYDIEKLNNLSGKYEEHFRLDGNLGLIKQLVQSFYKKNIQKLTKTFITLSLTDMASKVHLASAKEAESYVLNMIKDGEVYATINQKDGMVSFHDNPEKYDTPLMANNLIKQMNSCMLMDQNIKQKDKEITIHPLYIQKCMTSLSAGMGVSNSSAEMVVDEVLDKF